MPNYLDLRRELHEAVIAYSEMRRLGTYRSLDDLHAHFERIIEVAKALLQEEATLANKKVA